MVAGVGGRILRPEIRSVNTKPRTRPPESKADPPSSPNRGAGGDWGTEKWTERPEAGAEGGTGGRAGEAVQAVKRMALVCCSILHPPEKLTGIQHVNLRMAANCCEAVLNARIPHPALRVFSLIAPSYALGFAPFRVYTQGKCVWIDTLHWVDRTLHATTPQATPEPKS